MEHPGKRAGQSSDRFGIDALLPVEIARKAETIGAQKAHLDTLSLFVLAVLAGAFIALGAMFATTALAGADGVLPFGVCRVRARVVFSLGLILVVLAGAQLLTGNTLMVMAAGKVSWRKMLRAWAIVYAGNAGASGTAVLVFLSGQFLSGRGSVAAIALRLAYAKVALPFDRALFLGVLCNVLVCLAVWLSIGGRTVSDKILAMLFPVSAFVAAGFEHSVANMYLIPLGLLIKSWAPTAIAAPLSASLPDLGSLTWAGFVWSLVPVTLGNIIGGAGLVGAVYWFVYLRPQRPA